MSDPNGSSSPAKGPKKRKRFDDDGDDDDIVNHPAALTTAGEGTMDVPIPSLPEIDDATHRLINIMQQQIHDLTEKASKVDSLERRCRWLEVNCTCRGTAPSLKDMPPASEIDTSDLMQVHLKAMETPIRKLEKKTSSLEGLERRYHALEERRKGHPYPAAGAAAAGHPYPPPPYPYGPYGAGPPPHLTGPPPPGDRIHSLEERCRMLEAKLHVVGVPPPNGTSAAAATAGSTGMMDQTSPYDIIRRQEEAVLMTIDSYKRLNRWPLKRNKADIFQRDEGLKKLRLFSSLRFRHEKHKFDKAEDKDDEDVAEGGTTTTTTTTPAVPLKRGQRPNKQGIKSCALCASRQCSRKVRWKCNLCQIPLCTKKGKNGQKSCWEVWHTAEDLEVEREKLQKALVERRGNKAKKAGGEEDSEDDDDGDGEGEGQGEDEGGVEVGVKVEGQGGEEGGVKVEGQNGEKVVEGETVAESAVMKV